MASGPQLGPLPAFYLSASTLVIESELLPPQHMLILRDSIFHWPLASTSAIPFILSFFLEEKIKVSYCPQKQKVLLLLWGFSHTRMCLYPAEGPEHERGTS